MDKADSDERVMRRLAGGDEGALAELMNRWEGPIWCFIDRMGAGGAIEDVYQDLWTRVFQYRRRYRSGMPFRPYLFAIAVNCCRRAIKRRRQRSGVFTSLDDPPPAVDPKAAPVEGLIAAEEHQLLHRAIHRLPEAQRTVVLLYLLFSTDYGQIARVMGRSPGTVRSHMHHALAALRSSLTRISLAKESQVDHERQPNRKTR